MKLIYRGGYRIITIFPCKKNEDMIILRMFSNKEQKLFFQTPNGNFITGKELLKQNRIDSIRRGSKMPIKNSLFNISKEIDTEKAMDAAARKASTRHNTKMSKMSNTFGWERTTPNQIGSAGFGRLDAARAGAKKGVSEQYKKLAKKLIK